MKILLRDNTGEIRKVTEEEFEELARTIEYTFLDIIDDEEVE